MARGRPPKPTSRHKAEGTLRKDRHGDRRPAPLAPDAVHAPDDFDDDQRAAFESFIARLAAVGIVIKLSDAFAVERAAVALVTARRARAELAKVGRYHEGQRGLTLHPAARDEKAAWEAFASAASTLGLSPLDRERIKANESLDEDPLDALARERAEQRQEPTEPPAAAAPARAAKPKARSLARCDEHGRRWRKRCTSCQRIVAAETKKPAAKKAATKRKR